MNKREHLGIDDDRLKHMLQVGRRAQEIARDVLHWPEPKCRQMFILGLLHNCGYEFAQTQPQHEHLGGDVLRSAGYRYWREVYYHGAPTTAYSSDALSLLRYADLTTAPNGERISVEERVRGVARRYGEASIQYHNILQLAVETCLWLLQHRDSDLSSSPDVHRDNASAYGEGGDGDHQQD